MTLDNNHTKYFIIGLVVITILIALLLVKPYIASILASLVLAYIFHPFYTKLNKKIKRDNVSAFIVSVIIIIIITIPVAFVLYHVSQEANVGYIILRQRIKSGDLIGLDCTEGFFCTVAHQIDKWLANPEVQFYITDNIKRLSSSVTEGVFGFVFSLPKRIIDIFLTFFITFFFLRDGKKLVRWIEKEAPLRKKQRDRIFKQMHEVVRAIVYGLFLVGLLEGAIIAITFSAARITSPIIWGIIVGLLTFVPIVGGAIIWVPAMLITFANGFMGSSVVILRGGVLVSAIDTFWKPKVIGDKADIHPILVVLGVFGGVSLFGIVGIIIGPLILALLFTFIKMYKKAR